MEEVFSKEIQAGLDAARTQSLRRASRLRLDVDGVDIPVLRMWKTGFAVSADDAPNLRGLVDLCEGAKHLFQCLIVAGDETVPGEMHYEFKRATAVANVPPVDFVRPDFTPAALIGGRR
tara:strand:+ start:489 stop:845 length:357 start_codon:yes stop_codon:yes gene_type:complete